MAEKQYTYKTNIKQPQTVVNVKLDPKGGTLSEREYKTLKKDVYGASLLEKGLLVVEEAQAQAPDVSAAQTAAAADEAAPASLNEAEDDGAGETVPDFETHDASEGRPEDHAGWKPE
jgi:hypothetical protein